MTIQKRFAFSVFVFLIFTSSKIFPQFDIGKNYAGPSLGLSFLGSAFQLGANYEYAMSLNEIGIEAPGKLGVGGLFRYWSYSSAYYNGEWSYTDILLGAQGNYHFKLKNSKFDPWLGLVLAFDFGKVSWTGPEKSPYLTEPSHGGFWLGFHAGSRYWISSNIAVSARVGFGTLSYGALDLGVDFKF